MKFVEWFELMCPDMRNVKYFQGGITQQFQVSSFLLLPVFYFITSYSYLLPLFLISYFLPLASHLLPLTPHFSPLIPHFYFNTLITILATEIKIDKAEIVSVSEAPILDVLDLAPLGSTYTTSFCSR